MVSPEQFNKSVFINCPFDNDYLPLLHVLLFTVIKYGFKPRIATESSDSGQVRIIKIIELIRESKYSIHDISRMEAMSNGETPRFNMPFELGLDIGGRELGTKKMKLKRCLVLEEKEFRYQSVLSDISGNDIKPHYKDPLKLVESLRTWFVGNGVYRLASPTSIWDAYNDFISDLSDEIESNGFKRDEINKIPINEYIYYIQILAVPLSITPSKQTV